MNGAPARSLRVDEAYLAFVRAHACAFCGAAPPSDAHHLVNRKWREASRDDYLTLPACRECHARWHSVGPVVMLERCGITPVGLAAMSVDLVVEFFTREARQIELAF